MKKPVVYLNDPISPDVYERLAEKVEITDSFDRPERLEAIIVRQQYCKREVIENAPNLKIISMHGTGTDRIDMNAAAEFGVPVVTHSGYNAHSVAEMAVSLLLAANRKLKEINNGMISGKYRRFGEPFTNEHEVFGKTVGIYGTGAVGQEIACIMKYGFHTAVLGYNPHRTAEELASAGFEAVSSLEELLHRSDYLFVCPKLNEETRGSINAEILKYAKSHLVLCNVSRGGVVNEQDLYTALTGKTIKAAASDVFSEEPPSRDNPLLTLDNFIGTFHVGGSTVEAMERLGHATVDDVFSALGIS